MEYIDILLIILLSTTILIIVVACVMIFGHRRQAQSTAYKSAQESQPKVAQKAQPTRTEEASHTVTREAQEEGGEEKQSTGTEVPQLATKNKRLEPVKRGGRPRDLSLDTEKRPEAETKFYVSKPEIVCWKRERQWIPAIEVPDALLENPYLVVLQNGTPLTKDESREACWCLKLAFDEVVISWNDGENIQETKFTLSQEGYILFKLNGQDQNQGHRVRFPSSGSYLVMVPNSWERDEELSGSPQVSPESVSCIGYKAHFFELEKDGDRKIAFRTHTGQPLVIESKASRFELIGTRSNDMSENIGPLFCEKPPKIRALDDSAWKTVGTIVVGEEGSGKGRWRMAYRPEEEKTEQSLPPEISARKAGWYFLRLYDTNDDLIESLDFRFISALKEIKIYQPLPLPQKDGHMAVHAEFIHEAGCTVQPFDSLTKIQIERQENKTIITIPPYPDCDESRWRIGSEGVPSVEVTILVERLWWSEGEEKNEPSEWGDKTLTLSSADFTATSKKVLWLRFPRRRWVDKVLVGFERLKARPYAVKVTEKTIAVPFREFSDSEEVRNHAQKHFFNIWIERDDRFIEGVVGFISASQLFGTRPIHTGLSSTPYWVGFGRKKTAIARAKLVNGSGNINVNGQPMDDYFKQAPLKAKPFLLQLYNLEQVLQVLSRIDLNITVKGSTPTTMRQVKAVAHAIARALWSYDPELMPLLKQRGFGGVKVKITLEEWEE